MRSLDRTLGTAVVTSIPVDGTWNAAPESLTLEHDEVHVWRMRLDMDAEHVQELYQTLSEDECVKVNRSPIDKVRRRIIGARGMLRAILGGYLGIDPRLIRFRYGPGGKPALAETSGTQALRFNLSHSDNMALCAIAMDSEVGIDIEYRWDGISILDIARRCFSRREIDEIETLPENQRREAFFNGWTRKEAYLKARGHGLGYGLGHFSVSLRAEGPAALLENEREPEEVTRWRLEALTPHPDYTAAIAVERHDWHLKCWERSHHV